MQFWQIMASLHRWNGQNQAHISKRPHAGKVEENRKKNDVVFIPVGCTELHGRHLPSAADTLYVSAICEGVRRFTAKRGAAVNLALPPLNVWWTPISPPGNAGNGHRAGTCGA